MARQFAIIADTASDLPDEYYIEHELERINLGFVMDNVTYGGDNGEQMNVKEFYVRLRSGAMPTTFQVSPEQARAHAEPLLKQGKDVLILAFSSGLSGTANSMKITAEELAAEYPDRKIFAVDSLCASMGEGLFVDYVVRKADTGATIEETRDYAESIKLNICHEFTVDNLFHLKRGGRVTATAAVIGTLLKIKPVLHVDDEGHLIVVKKAFGRKKAIHCLLERMLERVEDAPDEPIFISHGDCAQDVDYLVSLLKEQFPSREVKVNYIGSVIGTHSGDGTLALFYRGKNR